MLGERLRMARAMAQLSMRELADRAGLSHQAIGKYEKGSATPSSKSLIRLAKALGVGIEFLMRPPVRFSKMEFRRKRAGRKKELDAIEAEIRDKLERYVQLEALMGGEGSGPLSRYTIRQEQDAEDVAVQWRDDWRLGFGPIRNLIEAVEAHGVKVVLVDAQTGFAGCAVRIDDDAPAVAVNRNSPHSRFRLTLAHELAHILVDGIENWATKEQEKVAFRLGAAFLVPRAAVYEELGHSRRSLDLTELFSLKRKYGLSMQAWIMRAWQLGVISNETKIRLFREMGRRGYRKNEPGDEVRTTSRSYRFERLLLRAVSEGCISEERAAELYGGSLEDIRDLMMERRTDAGGPDH